MAHKCSDDELLSTYRDLGCKAATARACGLEPNGPYYKRINKLLREERVEVDIPESKGISVEEIIDHKKKIFSKQRDRNSKLKLVNANAPDNLPIGIMVFGDPHVDNDGCNIEQLKRDMDITNCEGVYGLCIGDVTDNWKGRLERLYAYNSTTKSDALRLAEWYVKNTRWLFRIRGNHDAWSGEEDMLIRFARDMNHLYEDHVRMAINFPNGNEVRINARHNFKGNSVWNPVHGASKHFQKRNRDHILVQGHTHSSGYTILKEEQSGLLGHIFLVSGYKEIDRYAVEGDFEDKTFANGVFIVIDPSKNESDPDMIKHFWSAEDGNKYLQWLRTRAASQS